MSRRGSINSFASTAVILILSCSGYGMQSHSDQDYSRLAWERNEDFHRYEIDSNVAFDLPAPISTRDINRYAQILVLSEAQRKHLDLLHAEYLESIKALEQGQMQELVPLSKFAAEQAALTWEYLEQFDRMSEAVDEIESQIRSLDASLFSRLAESLGESQLTQMSRVRMHRQRACAPQFSFKVPVAKVDHSQILERSTMDEDVLGEIDPLRWQYEQRLTDLLADYSRICKGHDRKTMAFFVAARYDDTGQPMSPQSDVGGTKAAAAYAQMLDEQAKVGATIKRLAELNREYFPRFRDALPETLRNEFTLRYRIRAYPQLFYPDRGDPAQLFESIRSRKELPQDLRLVLEEAWQSYRNSYDSMNRRLEETYDNWKQLLADRGGYRSNEYSEYCQRMRTLFKQRVDANEEFLRRLKSLLPLEITTEFEADWRGAAARIAQERIRLDLPDYQFPGN